MSELISGRDAIAEQKQKDLSKVDGHDRNPDGGAGHHHVHAVANEQGGLPRGDDFLDDAVEGDELGPHCVRFRLRSKGPWLNVLGGGNPLNIVLNAGSPEPVLLHFALLGRALEHLATQSPSPGEHPVPRSLEAEVAKAAIQARR